jgi:hypothetical protein
LVAAYGGDARDPRAEAAKLFKGVEDVKGRWRGGHILGTGEIRHENWPTTEEVLEKVSRRIRIAKDAQQYQALYPPAPNLPSVRRSR